MAVTLTSSLNDITQKEKPSFEVKGEKTEERINRQKHEFFTLLATQLQNQDPTAPMDTNQMTQQIFAINQVEQQLESNKLLSEIAEHLTANKVNNAVSYIDKFVTYEGGDQALIEDGVGHFRYSIDEDNIEKASIELVNDKGKVVFRDSIPKDVGEHVYAWDNTKMKENMLQDGVYTFRITALDEDDKTLKTSTYGNGIVRAVNMDDKSHKLEVNGKEIPVDKIIKITDSSSGIVPSSTPIPTISPEAITNSIRSATNDLGDLLKTG